MGEGCDDAIGRTCELGHYPQPRLRSATAEIALPACAHIGLSVFWQFNRSHRLFKEVGHLRPPLENMVPGLGVQLNDSPFRILSLRADIAHASTLGGLNAQMLRGMWSLRNA